LFTWNPAPSGKTTILARVGVSFISSDQACANAEEEIPDFDFDKVHSDARAQWNDLLGRVQVDMTGIPKETAQLFYSSVRHSFFAYLRN
jgi:putative alpha-1,2-mannosidase